MQWNQNKECVISTRMQCISFRKMWVVLWFNDEQTLKIYEFIMVLDWSARSIDTIEIKGTKMLYATSKYNVQKNEHTKPLHHPSIKLKMKNNIDIKTVRYQSWKIYHEIKIKTRWAYVLLESKMEGRNPSKLGDKPWACWDAAERLATKLPESRFPNPLAVDSWELRKPLLDRG